MPAKFKTYLLPSDTMKSKSFWRFRITLFHSSTILRDIFFIKVHIFWEGNKILQNLHQLFDWKCIGQIIGADFAKFCGLLRTYELYLNVFTTGILRKNLVKMQLYIVWYIRKSSKHDFVYNRQFPPLHCTTAIVHVATDCTKLKPKLNNYVFICCNLWLYSC